MSTRTDLYSAFENYDTPTEDDFHELIDFAGYPVSFDSLTVTPDVDLITDLNAITIVVAVRELYVITYGTDLYLFSAIEGTYGAGGTAITNDDLVRISYTQPTNINNSLITLSPGDGLEGLGSFRLNQSSDQSIAVNLDDTVIRTTGDFTIEGDINFTGAVSFGGEELATQTWVTDQNYLTSEDIPSSVSVPAWVSTLQSDVYLAAFGGQLDASRIDNLPEATRENNLVFTAIGLPSGSSPTVTGTDPNFVLGIPEGKQGHEGDKGETGEKGASGTTLLGQDTVANIKSKANINRGDAWVATDAGVDDFNAPVVEGDALTFVDGTWRNIGPWGGVNEDVPTRTSDLINDGEVEGGQDTFLLTSEASFIGLNDTPESYSGFAGKFVKVSSAGTTLEFVSSVATSNYVHNQTVAAAVWNINHGMGKRPSVSYYDSLGREMNGGVEWVDDDNVTITFADPVAGSATLN